MKTIRLSALFALAIPCASFAQLVQTQEFNFTPNGNQTMTFNKVNLPIGAVTAIIVTVVLNKTGGYLAVDNDSASEGSVSFTHQLKGVLTSSNPLIDSNFMTTWTSLEATSSTAQSLGVTSGDPTDQFNVTAYSDYYKFHPGTVTDTAGANLNSGVFAFYLGSSGTYTMSMAVDQLASASGLGGLQQSFTVSQATGSVTVEVVPEPSTTQMLAGLGIVLVLFSNRRLVGLRRRH